MSSVGQETIRFTEDIRPVLSDRCFLCHGPDAGTREADLRLDIEDAAHEYSIVPGEPDESEVIRRIFSDDPDEVMPPPDSNLSLSDTEKEQMRAWVAQGAEYARHWAFESIKRPPIPRESNHSKPDPNAPEEQNPIDAFVRSRLAKSGSSEHPALEPSQPADLVTILRRMTLDLTGLPPTVAETQSFLADSESMPREQLLAALADRLLNSEKFGERMAVDWLDVARYADTHGYQADVYRAVWPWRDWVIDAFNEGLPYDEFITWQLAGDLMPNASQEQRLATAFNRLHRQTNEGGSVEEEFRAEYVADRVNTFGAAFLGLTLECARCHDHKYDPVSQKEYYQLSAFFNNIAESGLYSHFTESTPTPALFLTSEQQERKLAELRSQLADAEQKLDAYTLTDEAFLAWREQLTDVRPAPTALTAESSVAGEQRIALNSLLAQSVASALAGDYPLESKEVFNRADDSVAGKVSDAPDFIPGRIGNAVKLSGDNNVTVPTGGDFQRDQPFSISLWLEAPKRFDRAIILHRSRAWTDAASRGFELLVEDGKLSFALVHFWPGNAIRINSIDELPVSQWTHVTLTYDGSSRASGLNIYMDGEQLPTVTIRDELTKTIDASPKEVALGQRFRDLGFKNGKVDELKIFNRELNPLEVRFDYLLQESAENVPEVLYNIDEKTLRAFALQQDAEYQARRDRVQDLRTEVFDLQDAIPDIMVMEEEPTLRPTYILTRGAYDAPGEEVGRAYPSMIVPENFYSSEKVALGDAQVPTNQSHSSVPNRLDLAQWLTDPAHPLTARVAVNRFWQSLFGQGLVSTSEDFGLQGSLPTHPQLLDWLSAEFIESGWNVKHLLRLIVLSKTYQQCSDPTPKQLELDPQNELLSRGPAVRLSAEMIRDTALLASGLLIEKVGGPPVKPYQPDGLWKEKSGKSYEREKGEGSHRRSLYTYWKRTSPPPAMMTLDASNREVCVVRRQVTLTPLQVLVLLNDPQYVEAAKALAARAIETNEDLQSQLEYMFQSLATRQPSTQETRILERLFQEQFEIFQSDPEASQELLAIGDHSVSGDLDKATLAAMTVIAEGLMSYDETIMKR